MLIKLSEKKQGYVDFVRNELNKRVGKIQKVSI
jgi:hypothetical protein